MALTEEQKKKLREHAQRNEQRRNSSLVKNSIDDMGNDIADSENNSDLRNQNDDRQKYVVKWVSIILCVVIVFVTIFFIGMVGVIENRKKHKIDENEETDQRPIEILSLSNNNLKWENKDFGLVDVSAFQERIDHGYYLYVILKYDVSKLNDDDLYWMIDKKIGTFNETNLKNSVVISSKQNSVDNEKLTCVNIWRKGNMVCYAFVDFKERKYNYDDMSIEVNTDIRTNVSASQVLPSDYVNYYANFNESEDGLRIEVLDVDKMNDEDELYLMTGISSYKEYLENRTMY